MPLIISKRFVDCMKMPTAPPLPVVTDGKFPYPTLEWKGRDIPQLLGHALDAGLTGALRLPCATGLGAAGGARLAWKEERLAALKVVPYTAAGLMGGLGLGLAGATVSSGDAGACLAAASLTGLKVCGTTALQGVGIALDHTVVPVLKGVAIVVGAAANLLQEVFT